jgi:hypothetical protein
MDIVSIAIKSGIVGRKRDGSAGRGSLSACARLRRVAGTYDFLNRNFFEGTPIFAARRKSRKTETSRPRECAKLNRSLKGDVAPG